jgi:phospholipase C
MCQPKTISGVLTCTGPDWTGNVVIPQWQVLEDISNNQLSQVSWIIPDGTASDHAESNNGSGPSWVASIVNAIGNSQYWANTAIILTWDDWGGWYDHEPPTILAQPQGDYQYGLRVPLVVVSAYTPAGYIDNGRHDFGSMVNFVENNFGVEMGILGFADARAGSDDLAGFFDLTSAPRPFAAIPTALSIEHFINDTSPVLDPDTD